MGNPAIKTGTRLATRMLVEALVRTDHTVDTAELYSAAALLGMTDQQVRLCVKRLVAEGRFTLDGRGRKAVLRATDITEQALGLDIDFVAHAFQQDAGHAPWDETWHLVAFAVPETARVARDALRNALTRLGGAFIQGGLYVSANAWEPYVESQVRHLALLDQVTFATTRDLRHGNEANAQSLARRLWPLAEIADRYDRLADIAAARIAQLRANPDLSAPHQLAIAVELAAEFTRAMEPDPLLPPELLPQPWPGTQARKLIAQSWALLGEQRQPHGVGIQLFGLYDSVIPHHT